MTTTTGPLDMCVWRNSFQAAWEEEVASVPTPRCFSVFARHFQARKLTIIPTRLTKRQPLDARDENQTRSAADRTKAPVTRTPTRGAGMRINGSFSPLAGIKHLSPLLYCESVHHQHRIKNGNSGNDPGGLHPQSDHPRRRPPSFSPSTRPQGTYIQYCSRRNLPD